MKVAGAADTPCDSHFWDFMAKPSTTNSVTTSHDIVQKFASVSMLTNDQVYCTLSILELSNTEGRFMKLNIDADTTTHHGLNRIQTSHSLQELDALVDKNLPIDFICPSEPIIPNLQTISFAETTIHTCISVFCRMKEVEVPRLQSSSSCNIDQHVFPTQRAICL
ncbi:hypothetical protein LIER_35874 [Lithospermum erythrorhizon]|uniref:Uncharacterized protein n=1 Tax=Lithospermum erythrorhizon TaxID=34254 RepID=A0AAV3NXX5_LITER